MTEKHPITPPPKLVEEWVDMLSSRSDQALFTMIAQWGADQELEACLNWLDRNCGRSEIPASLQEDRRPKPPSLKEQALDELVAAERLYPADWSTIRRALEALDD
jgi:hypothetical protein